MASHVHLQNYQRMVYLSYAVHNTQVITSAGADGYVRTSGLADDITCA